MCRDVDRSTWPGRRDSNALVLGREVCQPWDRWAFARDTRHERSESGRGCGRKTSTLFCFSAGGQFRISLRIRPTEPDGCSTFSISARVGAMSFTAIREEYLPGLIPAPRNITGTWLS